MEKLKELGVAANVYISKTEDANLKERLRETTLHSILKILSKYFVNYKYTDLKVLFNASEEDIRHLGFTITEGFIEMKVEEVHSDCLLTKLRELAIVANKMNKFE